MSLSETHNIAHTVRCKLQLAVDRPDRNLRFILGHAFTLDNIRVQLAQVDHIVDLESESEEENEDLDGRATQSARGLNFHWSANGPVARKPRRSPPPEMFSDSDSSLDEDGDEKHEDDEERDLHLERFGPAVRLPPKVIDGDGKDDELAVPSGIPSKEEIELLTQGEGNAELVVMYQAVAECICRRREAPKVEKAWDVPQNLGEDTYRLAIIQVAA